MNNTEPRLGVLNGAPEIPVHTRSAQPPVGAPPSLPRREQHELVQAAVLLARRSGAPVIARLHLSLEALDPWSWWQSLDEARWGGVSAAWAEPAGGISFLAAGEVVRIEGPLDRAGPRCRRLLERWIDARADVPAAVAGFAFAGAGGRDPVWSGFGAGRITIPRVVVWRRGSETGAAVAAEIGPDSDADVVQAELDTIAADLAGGARPRSAAARLATTAVPCTGDGPDRQAWMGLVDRARAAVAGGGLAKLVVARRRLLEAPAGQAWHAEDTARALRAIEPHAQVFAVRGDQGWFVGATPELLAEVHGGQLSTVALAGTRARGADPAEDERLGEVLWSSAKDRLEHAIVVEAIRQQLGALSRVVHTAEAPRLVRFRAVMHLETRVTAALQPDVGVLEVARALHPTPAVSGAPQGEALAWLEREEQLDRGWYAGPIGWLDAAQGGHLAVALRSAVLEGAHAHAHVGCGIVAASDPAAEWDETEHKLASIARALSARDEAESHRPGESPGVVTR